MARIRTVKPEFWTDEKILKISIPARLFFIGLWNWADDNGVLENKPMQLKARIFPCDDVSIQDLVNELAAEGLIQLYQPNGEALLLIRNFNKHQVIDRPRKSNLELPNNDENQLKSIEISSGREGKGRERKGSILSDFETFWKAYPNKVGKGAALKAWEKIKPSPNGEFLEKVLAALLWQTISDKWKKNGGEYIPNPSTWLNQKRWLDEPRPENKSLQIGASRPEKLQRDPWSLFMENFPAPLEPLRADFENFRSTRKADGLQEKLIELFKDDPQMAAQLERFLKSQDPAHRTDKNRALYRLNYLMHKFGIPEFGE